MTPRRRGFTLVELALATVLGSIVLLAAFSIFASLGSADAVGQEAFEEANAAANAHEAITIALQTLAMSNTVPPPRNSQGERTRPGRENEEPGAGSPEIVIEELPRLLLEPDDTQPAMMEDLGSRTGELMRPQRLEVTLRARPVFVFGEELELSVEDLADLGYTPAEASLEAADRAALSASPSGTVGDSSERSARGSSGESAAGDARDRSRRSRPADRRSERRSGSDRRSDRAERENGSSDGANAASEVADAVGIPRDDPGAGVTTELVQGVRGAFELEFDPGIAGGGLEPQAGWVLWWRQIYPVVEAPLDMDPIPGQQVGRARLMGNIASAAWNVLYTKRATAGQGGDAERLREHVAIWADDLPGYLELDLVMNSGTRYQWTFEVNWGVSGEPGTVASISAPPTQPGAAAAAANGPAISGLSGATAAPGADRSSDRARTPTSGAESREQRRRGGGRSSSSSSGMSSSGSSSSGEERRR
jgi:prepilin-type N-terminal cleavage/methylation domain-containing protein